MITSHHSHHQQSNISCYSLLSSFHIAMKSWTDLCVKMQIRSCHMSKSSKIFVFGIKSKSSLCSSRPYITLFQITFLTSFSTTLSLSHSTAPTLTFVLFLKNSRHILLLKTVFAVHVAQNHLPPHISHDLWPQVFGQIFIRNGFPDSICTLTIIILYCLALLFLFLIAWITIWHIYLFIHLWFSSHH